MAERETGAISVKTWVVFVFGVLVGLVAYMLIRELMFKAETVHKPTGFGVINEETTKKLLSDPEVALAAVVDFNGNITLLSGPNAEYSRVELPLRSEITNIRPITVVAYRGSHCLLWSDGTSDAAPGAKSDAQSGARSGGGASIGRYCVIRHK